MQHYVFECMEYRDRKHHELHLPEKYFHVIIVFQEFFDGDDARNVVQQANPEDMTNEKGIEREEGGNHSGQVRNQYGRVNVCFICAFILKQLESYMQVSAVNDIHIS